MFSIVKFGEFFGGVFSNDHIRIALVGMLLAQTLKVLYYFLKHRRWNFRLIVQPSGMPSSHTAMVMALSTSVGITEGWGSVAFAMAIIFSTIVMYDATGVRRAAGKQARILNMIMEDFFSKKQVSEMKLKELLGHTPLEVIFGCLLGIMVAFMYHAAYHLY